MSDDGKRRGIRCRTGGPKVYLVATTRCAGGLEEFGRDTGHGVDSDAASDNLWMVEAAGRTAYRSWDRRRPGGNVAHVGHLVESGHHSCLEFADFTFSVVGVSRSLTQELVRHRLASYGQESQRYVDARDCEFVVPPLLEYEHDAWLLFDRWRRLEDRRRPAAGADPGPMTDEQFALERDMAARFGDLVECIQAGETFDLWLAAMSFARDAYAIIDERLADRLKRHGVPDGRARRKRAREAARSVLPNATATRIVVKKNGRALRHFLAMRGSPEADAEIRRLAVAMFRLASAESPALFADLEVREVDGGECVARKEAKP